MNKEKLLFFDTNVIERFYLLAMLKGESIQDFELVTKHGYQPAIAEKTLVEIWQHAKRGVQHPKTPPWQSEMPTYPKGLTVKFQELFPSESNRDARNACLWWAEREGLDPLEHFDSLLACLRLIREEDREEHLNLAVSEREFVRWRKEMESFCDRIERALESNFEIIPYHEVFSTEHREWLRAFMKASLCPNEDFEIWASASRSNAVALETDDKKLINARISQGFAPGVSIVAKSQLRVALEDGFRSAFYSAS